MSETELKSLPTEVGIHKIGNVTVDRVQDKGKVIQFTLQGYKGVIKVWKSLLGEQGSITAGQAMPEFSVECKEDTYNGEATLERWMHIPKAQNGAGKGGGGFRPSAPKTPVEIHSASVCGIIKSAIEKGGDNWEATAVKAIEIYRDGMKKVGA
jgi:hypothetical protein